MHVLERRHRHPWPGMGTVLILLASSVIWHAATPDAGWARTVGVALEGLALVATLRISGETPRLARLATVLVPVAIVVTAIGNTFEGDLGRLLAGVLGTFIVVACPLAIVRSVLKHPIVNLQTVGAAICIYLLIGLCFTYLYGLEYAIFGAPFMNGVPGGRPTAADTLYFSFITLTTTGYGDITCATRIGRTTAMVEAMLGQLYLVTVLALLVSNLGAARRTRAELAAEPAEGNPDA
ncbi:MAG: potassium channel family protein [Actinomycetes bacterium]